MHLDRRSLKKSHFLMRANSQRTGLTAEEVRTYEERGVIRGTTKGKNQFYSLREVYRVKGIQYFIRTEGLTPEEAAEKSDKEAGATNRD